jgi:hypothetical protein
MYEANGTSKMTVGSLTVILGVPVSYLNKLRVNSASSWLLHVN